MSTRIQHGEVEALRTGAGPRSPEWRSVELLGRPDLELDEWLAEKAARLEERQQVVPRTAKGARVGGRGWLDDRFCSRGHTRPQVDRVTTES